jgi:glycosyltransferase involved in cell wall biosynthesis
MPAADGLGSGPRVVIGAPVFNHARECREAIESLLAQSFRDFRLVIVDDCSTDGTTALAQEYAATDSRVEYTRNERRLGMIDNWRRAFDVSVERWPNAQYFAWASDHDLWHPNWLEHLVAALDEAPEAVLAYPLNRRVGLQNEITDKRSWIFETRGVSGRGRRFRMATRRMSAGNMIYGLARVKDISSCGVFRHVLVPDRLLLMELSLRGEFRQVPEVLWWRRWYGGIFSLGRQRRSFFPNGRPLYAYVPWWISHASVLAWVYGVRGEGRPEVSRFQGVGLSVIYFFLAGFFNFGQQLHQLRLDILDRATFLKPAYDELHKLGVDKVSRRSKKLGRRVSKSVGLVALIQAAQKNLSDATRRQRTRTKISKWFRRRAGSVSRLLGKLLRAVPVIGPRFAKHAKSSTDVPVSQR